MTFGEKVRMFREQRGLTQAELAKMVNVSQPTINSYEHARIRPHPNTLSFLCRALRVKQSELEDDREEAVNSGQSDKAHSCGGSGDTGIFDDGAHHESA